MFYYVIVFIVVVILVSIKQINEYERGVKFTFGKFEQTLGPGWKIVVPVFQMLRKVDMRVKAVDVPNQEAITKDNVSVGVNAVIYYKVSDAQKAIIEVENFYYAVSQLAQTTMRNAVGEITLDELLSERDKISEKIKEVVDRATDPWGIKVNNVDLKDVALPENMKRTIAKQAEAEREKRAVIIKAEGEVAAAKNMSLAAGILSKEAGALHLRTLQSLNDLSSDQSNTIIFALPLELLKSFTGFKSQSASNEQPMNSQKNSAQPVQEPNQKTEFRQSNF